MNLLADPTYVLDLVSRHYGVTQEDILGPRKNRRETWPRHVAMYLLREYGHLTNVAIGAALRRDNSTVTTQVNKAARVLRMDREERLRFADMLADSAEPAIVLAITNQTLVEARAVVRRLEVVQAELESQIGKRMRAIA